VIRAKLFELLPELVTVKALVAHHLQVLGCLQLRDDMPALVYLAFDEQELDRQALRIGQRHDLGVAATSRPAHGLTGRAACRVGRALIHHHMRAIDQSDPAVGLLGQRPQQPFLNPLPCQLLIPAIDRAPRTEAIWQFTPRPRIAQPVKQRMKHHV
jgi:hypothetical protein